jgi:two-component system response regulator
MLKGGVIAFSARHATMPCVVRDISETGARLQVKSSAGVPDTFELIVELDGLEAHVETVWRRTSEIGVRFLAAPTLTAPRRAQIVASSTEMLAKPSLRRLPMPAQPSARPASALPAATRSPATRSPLPREAPLQAVGPAGPTVAPTGPQRAATPAASAAQAVAATLDAIAKPTAGTPSSTIPILVADDDPDDRMLIEDAFRESCFEHPVSFVEDGEELLQYLRGEGSFAGRQMPGLILLDLNMPRMDGRTALMHMKADRAFRRIPVIVLTTSRAEDDIQRTYDLGVSAYVPKPSTYTGLIELVKSLNVYWSNFVKLPAA